MPRSFLRRRQPAYRKLPGLPPRPAALTNDLLSMRPIALVLALTTILSSGQATSPALGAGNSPRQPSSIGTEIAAKANSWGPFVEQNLIAADPNRGQLESALVHFRDGGDPQKLLAIEFLIANMEGQGYTEITLVTAAGEQLTYNSLDYENYDRAVEALDALDVLGAQHGSVDFEATRTVMGLDVIKRL